MAGPEYEQLRAEYDSAFGKVRAEERRLRSIAQQSRPNAPVETAVRQRMAEALRAYRESRDSLARFLSASPPPDEAKIQDLAYRLWEEAGRPIGSPDEHWYRAEAMLKSPGR